MDRIEVKEETARRHTEVNYRDIKEMEKSENEARMLNRLISQFLFFSDMV